MNRYVCWMAALGSLCACHVMGQNKVSDVDDFVVPEGLQLTEFAATPMIYSPVSMDMDLQGRLWIVEDLNQTEFRNRETYSRISILEDTDKDGKADKISYFGPTFRSIVMGIAVFDNQLVVAMAPDIIVYTDVNRDLKFEEGVDKKEVILTGFEGSSHDHALHGIYPGPDGRWYFSHGNTGLDVMTRDGKSFHASSYYSFNRKTSIGKKSSDGHLYIGGVGMSVDPDGRNAEMIFHNARNTHDLVVTSFGDVVLGDNDDPAHARAAWSMKHSNYGYASLEDGSRSWEDSAKSWEEKVVKNHRRGEGKLRLNEGHWRQNYPGTAPPGVQWGAGAPTGNAFIEGDELGRQFRGTYLLCETVNQQVFAFRTSLIDAQVDLDHQKQSAFAVRDGKRSDLLLSDVAIALDGSLFVSDWNSSNNRRGRGGKEGAIYLITKAGQTGVQVPSFDFKSTSGLLEALKSPAANVRWLAANQLRAKDGITKDLITFYEKTENPYQRARVVWLLAAAKDPAAVAYAEKLLKDDNINLRMAAFRALLLAHPTRQLAYLQRMAADTNPAISREVAVHLRDVPYADAKPLIKRLVTRYDGKNRWYLEALGQAATGKEVQVYNELLRPAMPKDAAAWQTSHKMLAWRMQTKAALDDLLKVIIAQKPKIEEFRLLTAGFALTQTAEKRQQNTERFMKLKAHPAFADAAYQQTIQEFLDKDVLDKVPQPLTANYVFPKTYGKETTLSPIDTIAALPGNRANGHVKSAMCLMCHKIGDRGVNFGPNLSQWGQQRDVKVIIHNIVNPAAEFAHGFEKSVVLSNGKFRMEGVDVGYSHHAGAIRVKTVGGEAHKIGFRRERVKIERLNNHSWMPSASKLGLTDQDVRDIAEYLKTLE